MQRNIVKSAILTLMMLLVSACSRPVKVDVDCAWFEDQSFSEETKAWLLRDSWPLYVREDFDKVADNNDLYKKHCE